MDQRIEVIKVQERNMQNWLYLGSQVDAAQSNVPLLVLKLGFRQTLQQKRSVVSHGRNFDSAELVNDFHKQ